MVELESRPLDSALDRWWDATCEALQAGATKEDLYHMLKTRLDPAPVHNCANCLPDSHGPDLFYSEVPEGLIELSAAADLVGVKVVTLHSWIRRGRLPMRGRLRGSAKGGGFVLVCKHELLEYANSPRNKKGGRPRKTA